MNEIDKKIHELILGFTSKDYPIDSSYGLRDVTKGFKLLILKKQRAKDKEIISKVRELVERKSKIATELRISSIYYLTKELKQILEGK